MIGCGRSAPHGAPFHAAVDPNAVDGRIYENIRSRGAICWPLTFRTRFRRRIRFCGTFPTRNRLVGLTNASARAAWLHLRDAGHREHSQTQTDLQKTTSDHRHFLEACQLQLALPESVPLNRPEVTRPFQYWLTTATVRVKEMLAPSITPSVILPTSSDEVPPKLPLKCPREVSTRLNSPL